MSDTVELRDQWLTAAEVAAEYKRSEQQVRTWCRDGTLLEFGFRVLRTGNSWWIHDPRNVSRK